MNMNRLRRMWIPVLLQTAVALAACDDDNEDDDTPPTDGGGLDAGPDSGPKDSGASDAKVDATVMGIQCKMPAAKLCGPYTSQLPGTPPEPCCYSGPLGNGTTADSVCSGKVQGQCLPPAINDTRCPDVTIVTTQLKGCCSALTQRCGVNSNEQGLGCPDNETTEMTIKALIPSFSIPASAKRLCAAGDGGVGDGGTQALIWSGKTGMDAGQ